MLVTNLLDNAIKYTPVGGEIKVSIASEDGFACISISDSGPGIPPREREAVFQRFYRLHTLHTEGAGLGLAIVADTADRLSATVNLSSSRLGSGLQVDLRLPLS